MHNAIFNCSHIMSHAVKYSLFSAMGMMAARPSEFNLNSQPPQLGVNIHITFIDCHKGFLLRSCLFFLRYIALVI